MKAHDLARALLAGPNADVAWEDATLDPRGPTKEQLPYSYRFLSSVDGLRVTSDQKIVVIQTVSDATFMNPDYQP